MFLVFFAIFFFWGSTDAHSQDRDYFPGDSRDFGSLFQEQKWAYRVPSPECDSQKDFEFDKSECRKHYYNRWYRRECNSIANYHVRGDYEVECYHNYHHYNSLAHVRHYKESRIAKMRSNRIRIGGFNMFRPTTNQSLFKDMELLAQIIHREFDLLAAIELVPLHRKQWQLNNRIDGYIRHYNKILNTEELSEDERNGITQNLERAMFSYIVPGYIKVLEHLRKLDPNWALLLAARPESSRPEDTKEFVGYYYRASMVRPRPNKFCAQEISLTTGRKHLGHLYACLPWFDEKINRVFSRKPFIADFESGNFRFTMVSSHIIFRSPPVSNKEMMAAILSPAFHVTDYRAFPRGSGITSRNYARWAEVKLTLELMQTLRKQYGIKNIIYAADFNLLKKFPLWTEILKSFPGGEIYIDTPTSLSAMNGPINDYDHFIFDPSEVDPCVGKGGKVDAGVIDFSDRDYITERVFHVDYEDWVWKNFLKEFHGKWTVYGVFQNGIDSALYTVRPPLRLDPYWPKIEYYEDKFQSEFVSPNGKFDAFFNRYIKALSDHFPIYLNCRIK
ncbi:MAG: hypothetical protein OXB88_01960 [Bacteriovoracales bacterium]|nr:hypothetical protein [Bacteriovoracales bacterium]